MKLEREAGHTRVTCPILEYDEIIDLRKYLQEDSSLKEFEFDYAIRYRNDLLFIQLEDTNTKEHKIIKKVYSQWKWTHKGCKTQ